MPGEQPVTSQILPKSMFVEMLLKNVDKLSKFDRNVFSYGFLGLGVIAGGGGWAANHLFRRALNVTQGRIASNLPSTTLPFLLTVAAYSGTVSNPLVLGDLNCPTCAVTRGALVGVVGGGVYPLILALPLNVGLVARYNTAPMPEKGNVLRFWMNVSRPIARTMFYVSGVQGFFGALLASMHFDIYLQLLKLVDIAHEDLYD